MAYEIRARSLAEILDTSFALVRDRFGVLSGISFGVYVPLYLLLFGALASAGLSGLMFGQEPEGMPDVGLALGSGTVAMLLFLFGHCFALGALTATLGHTYLGTPIGLGAAARVGVSQIWRIIAANILIFFVLLAASIPLGLGLLAVGYGLGALGSLLGTVGTLLQVIGFTALGVLAIAALVFAGGMGLVLVPVVVLEPVGAMEAVVRTWTLLSQSFWRSIGITATAWLLTALVPGMFQFLSIFYPITGTILTVLVQIVAYLFLFAVAVVFYLDLRCRHESFELEHLARVVESLGAGEASAAR